MQTHTVTKDQQVKAGKDRAAQSDGGASTTLGHLPIRGLSATGRGGRSNSQPLPARSGGCVQVGRVMRRSRGWEQC